MQGLSLVAASGGHSSSRCVGLSLSRPLLLQSTGSRRTGSVVVAHGPSCSVACGIFPDQGSYPCPLHWQADSQPLRHQGSPLVFWRLLYTSILLFLGCNSCNILFFWGHKCTKNEEKAHTKVHNHENSCQETEDLKSFREKQKGHIQRNQMMWDFSSDTGSWKVMKRCLQF